MDKEDQSGTPATPAPVVPGAAIAVADIQTDDADRVQRAAVEIAVKLLYDMYRLRFHSSMKSNRSLELSLP
jgi:hypothetical protein